MTALSAEICARDEWENGVWRNVLPLVLDLERLAESS